MMKTKVLTISNSKSVVNSDTLLKGIALASAIPISLAIFSHRVLAEESAYDQYKRTDQTESLQAIGALSIDLGDSNDPLIGAEAQDLAARSIEFVQGLDLEYGHILTVRYLGKGRLGRKMRADPPPVGDIVNADTVSPVLSFDAFSPVTQNEYRITLPANALRAVGRSAEKRYLDRASPTLPAEGVADGGQQSSGVANRSWSNGDDDRYRAYGLNAPVTNSVHRRLVQLGGGCSGTLVGPRHVVTAGHCLWNRDTRRWSNNFWVRAGANGTSFVTRVRVDNQNIPAGQVLWYFTPAQFRNPSADPRPYDFGILVVPARLGDVTGWLGRYYLGGSTLASSDIFRRGYPACNAAIDGEPRIDEPSPCSPNHLYANAATCEVGEFAFQDASGWRRNLHHSCDASAGDSGSGLYVYRNDGPGVTAIHIASDCETTATAAPCTGSLEDRPLRALRITPEYSDWIGYFRGLYP